MLCAVLLGQRIFLTLPVRRLYGAHSFLPMANPTDPTTPVAAPGAPGGNLVPQRIVTEHAQVTYANFCRGTLTPDEVLLDFALNSNAFGVKVLDEEIDIRNRIVLSPVAAKRLLFLLNDMLRRHEQTFGEVEVDYRRRLKNPPPEGAQT
jgi:hypothetical protein